MRFVAGRGADKVCCRQRRCGEAVAGRGPSAQKTAGRGAAAKSHREDAAGRECHGEEDGGTVAESHREELLAGAPWRSCRPGVPWRRVGSGTATSSGKASNLPEGMHHREELLAGAPWQSCRPGAPWKRVGSGHGNKLRQGKQSAGRDAPSGRRCRQGRCSEEPSGSKQGKSPCCRQGKSPRGRQGKSHPVLQANKKESGKAHSLQPALVMAALVRVTGARPQGSSQLLLCSLELLW